MAFSRAMSRVISRVLARRVDNIGAPSLVLTWGTDNIVWGIDEFVVWGT